jgi:hypothetical protein
LSLGGGKYVVSAADVNALPKNVILADNGEQAAELKKR